MERLWFKIGETATRIGVKPKDLRYWEQVIPEIRPRRSHGNLRYYHLDELPRLERIRGWLGEGLTVGDCRQLLLTGQLTRGFDFGQDPEPDAPVSPAGRSKSRKTTHKACPLPDMATIVESLRKLRDRLAQVPAAGGSPKPQLDEWDEHR